MKEQHNTAQAAPVESTPYPGCSQWGMRDTPATAQAAESLPAAGREQERIAFKDVHRHLELDEVPDAWARPMFKHSHVEASWLGWIARAARAQADSQPATDEIVSMAREQGLPETEIEGVFRVNADDLRRVVAAVRAARKQGANHD